MSRPKSQRGGRGKIIPDAQRDAAQAKVAAMLARGHTVASAARALNMSRDQAYHLMRSPEGRAAVRAAAEAVRAEALATARARIEGSAELAVDTLLKVIRDPKAKHRDLISASTAVLDRVGLHPKRTVEHKVDAARYSDEELEQKTEQAVVVLREYREQQERAREIIAEPKAATE